MIRISSDNPSSEPPIFIRLHLPRAIRKLGDGDAQHYGVVPWNGETHLEIPLSEGNN